MATMSSRLTDLCERYWEARLDASPLAATFLGDHRYDDRADDLSETGQAAQRDTWTALLAEAEAVPTRDLSPTEVDTRELLVGELRDAVALLDARLVELASDQMEGVHADLLIMAGQLHAPTPEHAAMAVTRVAALARMLDDATDRFRAGLAAGRTPAAIVIGRSLNQLDGYLASPLDGDPFAGQRGPDGWDGEAAWRAELTNAVATRLRPAFARYRAVLADELAPVARPDDRAGLCRLDGGDELYRLLVRSHTGLDLDPEELHEIGRRQVLEELPEAYRRIGARTFGTEDLGEIFRRILHDPDLRYGSGEEILDHARACLARAEAVVGDWFGLLPQASCELTPVPDYLAADSPAAYYTPPAPDGSRPGEYHVNLHDPTGRSRAETASIAFHEAVPGHHLQLAIAAELTDLPAFRRLSWGHTAFVEGWALYTEQLAEEMGLYVDDLDRLGMLASDSWRACRLVVDTGLHAFGWSRQQAIDFMVAHAPVNRDEIETEVDRYIGMPAQALAYKVGQREILRLRAEAEAALGSRFDVRGFHDAVLGGATVSLPVLARRVRAWMGS